MIHNHYKDKQKERRGSDSDLVKTKKFLDENAISDDKKRRLSQSELPEDDQPVLGSTNVGTIAGLPQKIRKDKVRKIICLNVSHMSCYPWTLGFYFSLLFGTIFSGPMLLLSNR